MISLVLKQFRKILIPDPQGSIRADWIVDSAQDDARLTPGLIEVGEKLYVQLVDAGYEHRDNEPLAQTEIVKSNKNPLSRRRTRRVTLNP